MSAVEPFRDPRRRRGARRTSATAWRGPACRTRSTGRAGSTGSRTDYLARAGRVLARRLRLARPRGAAQRAPAVPHRDRRAVHPLRPRPVAASGRPTVAARARLARLDRRVPRRDSAADRPGGARRGRGRRVPRRRAVAAGLRVLGTDSYSGLGRGADRARVHGADGPSRLRPVRRAGRRLGRAGRDDDRCARSRALRGDPREHADRRPARRRGRR